MALKKKLFPNLKQFTSIFSIALLVITLLILTLRLTVFSDVSGQKKVENDTADLPGVTLTEDEEIKYTINQEIYFATPDAAAEFNIANPDTSPYDIRVSIARNDNGRTIYISGPLRPGSSISTAKLQGARLPEGTYECTAEVSTYEVGTSTVIESKQIPVTIHIGNNSKPE